MKDKWFKSKPIVPGFSPEKVDREAGIIRDVVMAQAGEAKGHGFSVDQSFIEDLVNYDIKHYNKTGLKARFGHPGMSDSTMGKQMGVFRNFRLRENQAIADLHLLDSADQSPTAPGMREWMLSMATERPDFVMSSIVFKVGNFYQFNDKGERVPLAVDRWGDPIAQFDGQDIYATMADHFYTDIVEQGAITDHLFSQQFNQHSFAVQAVEFVQEHPDLLAFLRSHPEKLAEFAEKLGIDMSTEKKSFADHLRGLRSFLLGESDEAPSREEMNQALDAEGLREELRTELETAHNAQLAELQTQLDAANARIQELTSEVETLTTTNTELSATIAQHETTISELRERVPEEHTELEKEGAKTGEGQKALDDVTQRERNKYFAWKRAQERQAKQAVN